MNRPSCLSTWLAALSLAVLWSPLFAQEAPPAEAEDIPKPTAEAPKDIPKATPKLEEQGPHRRLAPGVMYSVDSARELEESFSRHNILELLAVNRNFDWAMKVPFRHDVWALDFKFKPVRMIYVDIPQPSGQLQRKLIWYMVYSVTNPGKIMHPVEQADGTYKVEYADELKDKDNKVKGIRFIPQFQFVGYESLKEEKPFRYPDKVVPLAVGPIRMREDRNRKFLTTVEMSARDIAVGETLWGVVAWEDVNLRIKRFSIYVGGLTNAYRWEDDEDAFKNPADVWVGKGRRLLQKTLILNFWRPGDEYYPHEEEIRYGVPGEPDYTWKFLKPN